MSKRVTDLLNSWKRRLDGLPDWAAFGAVFLAAFTVRLVYFWQVHDSDVFNLAVGDGYVYDLWAQRIAAGEWFGGEVFYQAPLYPYFLAVLYSLFGHDLAVVRVFQFLLGSAACALAALAGRDFFSRNTGLLAGVLLAFYAPAVYFDGLIQKAPLDLFFSTLLLVLLGRALRTFRPRFFLAAGVVSGLFALTRENALILPPLLAAWTLLQFRESSLAGRGRRLGWLALGAALVLMPVAWRNWRVGGEFFVTTSQFGPNFFIGNNERSDGRYMPLLWGRGSALFEREDAIRMAEAAEKRKLTPGEVSAFWTRQAFEYIRSRPADWARLMVRKWMMVWNGREIGDSEEPDLYYDQSVLAGALSRIFFFGTLCPLAVVGLAWSWPQRRRLWILYALLFGFAFSVALFFVFARYRYPMVPLLALFAASGLLAVARAVVRKAVLPVAASVLLAGVTAVAVNWNLIPSENPRALSHYNLGVALDRDGRPERAKVHYEQALRNDPGHILSHVNLGIILARNGDYPGALLHYDAALGQRPQDPMANNNKGNTLVALGRTAEAIECFNRALAADPNNAVFHNNIANALAKLERFDDAIAHYRTALRLEPGLQQARDNLEKVLERKGAASPRRPGL